MNNDMMKQNDSVNYFIHLNWDLLLSHGIKPDNLIKNGHV